MGLFVRVTVGLMPCPGCAGATVLTAICCPGARVCVTWRVLGWGDFTVRWTVIQFIIEIIVNKKFYMMFIFENVLS